MPSKDSCLQIHNKSSDFQLKSSVEEFHVTVLHKLNKTINVIVMLQLLRKKYLIKIQILIRMLMVKWVTSVLSGNMTTCKI